MDDREKSVQLLSFAKAGKQLFQVGDFLVEPLYLSIVLASHNAVSVDPAALAAGIVCRP